MTQASDLTGSLEVALAHANRLLPGNPAVAAQQAREILRVIPNQPSALVLLGIAQRLEGSIAEASNTLELACTHHPSWFASHYELGLTYGLAGRGDAAIAALKRAVQLKPDLADAWRVLADHLHASGDIEAAQHAYAQHIKTSARNPQLLKAGAALCENQIAQAEALLREYLKQAPTDPAAIRMFAEVAARLGRYRDAENLLQRCLELAPSFHAARHNYALVLHRHNKPEQALAEIQRLLAVDARNPSYRNLKAAILSRIGEYEKATAIYAEMLQEYPAQPKAWMSYGHALKTDGRQEESIRAYRKCIELAPHLGEAYWSLANLKTFRFTLEDVEAMRAQLAREDLGLEDRFHFEFALGKALEDEAQYEESFHHYMSGNALRRKAIHYDADETSAHVRRSKQVFTREFFAEHAGLGAQAPDPIFIVGLPRSGSTLIEQILASHPLVEGTMELPDITSIARSLSGRRGPKDASQYPESLVGLSAEELRALGERYLAQTRIQRKTDAPFFIDKMPNNFAHVGLIHLILPNAKMIDARRHPLGCCFSGFKQHFARGQHFTYGLEEIGRYYRDYVELMAHYDRVLPGRVHRVIYETLIDSTEAEIAALLHYCGLPFDERCLRFHETDRAVRTASSEQVRQPIFREGLDHWRHFEPWLDSLKHALGPVLERYPAVPLFDG